MKLLFIVVSLLLLTVIPARQSVQTADVVFKNGNIYTANDKASTSRSDRRQSRPDRIRRLKH